MDKQESTTGVFIDLKKAFDTIEQKIDITLLKKGTITVTFYPT